MAPLLSSSQLSFENLIDVLTDYSDLSNDSLLCTADDFNCSAEESLPHPTSGGGGGHDDDDHGHGVSGAAGAGHEPTVILFIFGCCIFGACTRSLIHQFRLPVPYTVLLLLIGVLIGVLSKYVPNDIVRDYTTLARGDPHIILHTFLPVLIFESAFVMDFHTLVKSFVQIALLALPGLVLASFLTCLMPKYIFNFGWSWEISMMFGSIMSATDPVAVVALLHDLGASKQLATLIEGESLLNDGAAIVIFNVCLQQATPGARMTDIQIVEAVFRYTLASPLFGFVMGKIFTFWLSKIFNDALTEITITLAATYVTYFICETLFKASGVLAVVVLGLTINAGRTSISPEVEAFLHRFWEMLAYLANTLIFILVGVVIVEQALPSITITDGLFVLALYCNITVIRGVVIALFSPILSKIGYGLTWRMGVVMTWGGLRGAVSLTLALLVAHDYALDNNIGNKFLVHTACIVMLTLVLNATTTQYLLKVLGMSDISAPKRMAMASAIRHLKDVKNRSLNVLKNDRFLADADWTIVDEGTEIIDPYKTKDSEAEMDTLTYLHRFSKCPDCASDVQSEPSMKEKEEMEEEARLRMLKAQKVSYWKQFEHGLLSQEAVRKLTDATEVAADKPGCFINVDELKKTWQVRGIFHFLKSRLERWIQTGMAFVIPPPKHRPLIIPYKVIRHMAFEIFFLVVIVLNLGPIIAELVVEAQYAEDPSYNTYQLVFRVINLVFFALYIVEVIFKILGERKYYLKSFWNYFDLLIIIFALVDVVIDLTKDDQSIAASGFSPSMIRIAKALRLLRISRALRLFKAIIPQILGFLNGRINKQLSLGYDVGKGYVFGEEEVRKYIDQIVDDKRIAMKIKSISDTGRLQVVRELGLLQRQNPGIAVSVKTRQAMRNVLNNIRENLEKLRGDGLLDEIETKKLERLVEIAMKRISALNACIPPPPPERILTNISWIGSDDEVIDFMQNRAKLMSYDYGDEIIRRGDPPTGIYIIISGMVKVKAKVNDYVYYLSLYSQDAGDADPDEEYIDYLTSGNVIGEMGILTMSPRNCTIICETSTQCYYIKLETITAAIEQFDDLEDNLWRVCAVRLASAILMKQPKYQGHTQEAVKMLLESAYLADLRGKLSFTPEPTIMQDVILINGICQNAHTKDTYHAPCYIDSTVTKLVLAAEGSGKHVILIIPSDADQRMAVKHSVESSVRSLNNQSYHVMHDETGSTLCLRHASQHRIALKKKLSDEILEDKARHKHKDNKVAPSAIPKHMSHHSRKISLPSVARTATNDQQVPSSSSVGNAVRKISGPETLKDDAPDTSSASTTGTSRSMTVSNRTKSGQSTAHMSKSRDEVLKRKGSQPQKVEDKKIEPESNKGHHHRVKKVAEKKGTNEASMKDGNQSGTAESSSAKQSETPNKMKDANTQQAASDTQEDSISQQVAPDTRKESMAYQVAPGRHKGSITHQGAPGPHKGTISQKVAPDTTHQVAPDTRNDSITHQVTPETPKDSTTRQVAPDMHKDSTTHQMAPDTHKDSTTHQVAPDTHKDSTTHQVAPDTHKDSTTRQVAPDTHKDSTIRQVAPDTHKDSTTRQVAPDTHKDSTIRQVAPDTHKDSTTHQVAPDTHKDSTTHQVAPDTHKDSTTRHVASDTHKDSTTRQVAPDTHKDSTTHQVAPDTHKDSTTHQVAPDTHKDSTTRHVASDTHKDSTTRQVAPDTHKDSTTRQVAPDTHQDSTTRQVAPDTHKDITTHQVGPDQEKQATTDNIQSARPETDTLIPTQSTNVPTSPSTDAAKIDQDILQTGRTLQSSNEESQGSGFDLLSHGLRRKSSPLSQHLPPIKRASTLPPISPPVTVVKPKAAPKDKPVVVNI